MKKLLTLIALLFLAQKGMAQCSPSFTYHQTYATTGDPYAGEIVNTTVYTGPGTATYSLAFPGGSTEAIIDSIDAYVVTEPVTMYMTVYDSATSTLVCSDSVTNTIYYSYPACLSYFPVAVDSAHFRLDSTYVTVGIALDLSYSDYSFAWSFPDGSTGTGGHVNTIYTGVVDSELYALEPWTYDTEYSMPYTVIITGGGCSITLHDEVSLPHEPFNCSYYYTLSSGFSDDLLLGGVTSGVIGVAHGSAIHDGDYLMSAFINWGDGTTTVTPLTNSVTPATSHTYDYSGFYGMTYTITMTNMTDSEHQTCIVHNVPSWADTTDSGFISVLGMTAPPIGLPASEVTICAGDTLFLRAADTMHSPRGYYTNFLYNVNPAFTSAYTAPDYIEIYSFWTAADSAYSGIILGDDSTMIIPNISIADSGTYTFQIWEDIYDYPRFNYPIHVTVLPSSVTSISGSSTVCAGATTTLTDSVWGGVWSSTGAATVDTTGMITGVGSGAATISYTISNACGTHTATTGITVNPLPTVDSIMGDSIVCVGSMITLTDAVSGGVWSDTSMIIAAVTTAGVATGVSTGTSIVSYTVTNSCGTATATKTLNTYATPVLSPITGTTTLCAGLSETLSESTIGVVWSCSPATSATISSTGVITAIAPGTVTIVCGATNVCGTSTVDYVVDIHTAPTVAPITGTAAVCAGGSTMLSDTTSGGTWSSTSSAIGVTGGVVTTTTAGTSTISYSLTNDCSTTAATITYTAYALPDVTATAAHTGFCTGGGDTLTATGGLTYNWSPSTGLSCAACAGPVATTAGTYVVTGVDVNGCSDTGMITIVENALPVVSASATTICSSAQTLSATGAATYSWAPSADLSCTTCGTTTTAAITAVTYTVTGTDVNGCMDTATVAPNANRIIGHVTFSGTAPDTTDVKIWLIQFNPADSSLIALDSTTTCLDSGTPFFEFDGKPAGNYMVKGKLLYGDAPGVSGYMPTYSLSTPYWYAAAAAAHTTATDSLPISMMYGTVPSGPGFIGGLIVSGAGKGTSADVPVPGMIVYIRNTATNILTYVYTDASGMYSFTGLAYGSYDIFPTDFDYYTTPSATIDLASGADTMLNVNFKQHTTFGTITPYGGPTKVAQLNKDEVVMVYPNPATSELTVGIKTTASKIDGTATLRDMWGKEMSTTAVTAAQTKIDLSQLPKGVYMINVQTATINYSGKVVVE